MGCLVGWANCFPTLLFFAPSLFAFFFPSPFYSLAFCKADKASPWLAL